MAGQKRTFTYRLDASDRIVEVDEAWCRFAAENGAEGLERRVRDRPLWEFIEGSTVSALYRALMERIRSKSVEASVPFRCDAPDRRRFMELRMGPDEAGGLRCEGRLLREESRPAVALLDPSVSRGGRDLIRMCAWCKRIEDQQREWIDVETALARHRYLEEPPFPRITHGICAPCAERMEGAAVS